MLIILWQLSGEWRLLPFPIAPGCQSCCLPSCMKPGMDWREGSGPKLTLSELPVPGTHPADPHSCPDPTEDVKEKSMHN